jgi:hypothetical protein
VHVAPAGDSSQAEAVATSRRCPERIEGQDRSRSWPPVSSTLRRSRGSSSSGLQLSGPIVVTASGLVLPVTSVWCAVGRVCWAPTAFLGLGGPVSC